MCEAVVVTASIKSCLVLCYTVPKKLYVVPTRQVVFQHLQCCGAPFSTCMFCVRKVALLTHLARTGLLLRTKAISSRSAASSGHRQNIVGGRINLNEEMEKAISRQGFMKDLVEAAFDFQFVLK